MKGTVRGECRWNYRLLISWSRVRSPPPHPRCSSVVERVFHHGRSLLAKRPTCRRVQCARRSVGEQPLFKRRVVGSIPTGHTRKYTGGMPAGLHLWLKAFGPAVRIRCPAQTCPPEQKRKEPPGECRRNYIAHLRGSRAGSTPLLAGAQTANAWTRHAGRVPMFLLVAINATALSPGGM